MLSLPAAVGMQAAGYNPFTTPIIFSSKFFYNILSGNFGQLDLPRRNQIYRRCKAFTSVAS